MLLPPLPDGVGPVLSAAALLPGAAGDDLARGATIAVVTAVAVVALLLAVGLVLLFRRRSGAQPSSAAGMPALRTRANVLLVRADEAVTSGEDELGFAVAQFGQARTADFQAAIVDARGRLAEAFRLQQALDDAVPESAQKKREWTLQIVALCEAAIAAVNGQDRDFASLRSVEADSPARIAALRARLLAARSRLAPAARTVERLAALYEPALIEGTATAVETATVAIDSATESLDEAEKRLSPSGVNTVIGLLEDAEGALQRAIGALDRVDGVEARLEAATSALDALVASTVDDLAEARAGRASAPDADTGQAIIRAIAQVEEARAVVARGGGSGTGSGTGTGSGSANPVRDLDTLASAVSALDTALATARNQTQRLEHARTALAGTLVSADSQIAALRSLVAGGGRRIGAEARTRLAEAERQLMLARAEADPVEALDAARRAVTHARDGDALAHYDTMGLGR